MMRAGNRRHRITIQSRTDTKVNGVSTPTWSAFATVDAYIEQLSRFNRASAQAVWPGADYEIGFPYVAGITGNMRAVDADGTIYSILGRPNDVDNRHREIILTCQSGVKAV